MDIYTLFANQKKHKPYNLRELHAIIEEINSKKLLYVFDMQKVKNLRKKYQWRLKDTEEADIALQLLDIIQKYSGEFITILKNKHMCNLIETIKHRDIIIETWVNKFKNGEERYNKDPLFNKIIRLLSDGITETEVIELLLKQIHNRGYIHYMQSKWSSPINNLLI